MYSGKKMILVDLDGALISANSFHEWIKLIWFHCATDGRVLKRIPIVFQFSRILFLRLFKLIDHSSFKFRVQEFWSGQVSEEGKEIVLRNLLVILNSSIRDSVLSLLKKYLDDGAHIVLATAAPGDYAQEFGKSISIFDDVLSTPGSNSEDWYENARERKAKSVSSYLERMNASESYKVLFTDHEDDMDLVEISDAVYLLPPLSSRIDVLEKSYKAKQFEVLTSQC